MAWCAVRELLMDVEGYLLKRGWKKGEGLKPGSIKKALLIGHKRDLKGLGFNPQASEGWWERVFDGHLKALNVDNKSSKVDLKFDEEKRRRETSPLYASFISGGFLNQQIGKKRKQKHKHKSHKRHKH